MTEIDDVLEEIEAPLNALDGIAARVRVLLDYRNAPNFGVIFPALQGEHIQAENRQLLADFSERAARLTNLLDEAGAFERAAAEESFAALKERLDQAVTNWERLQAELQSVVAQDLIDESAGEEDE